LPGFLASEADRAFDLPPQTGYGTDHPLARGEIGKVGVPVAHLGKMGALLAEISLARLNTSMTINATAPWLLALFVTVAEEQSAAITGLHSTVRDCISKEYFSQDTFIAPAPSLQMNTTLPAGRRSLCRSETRRTTVPSTCRRPDRRRSRNWPSRWRLPARCGAICAPRSRQRLFPS